MRFALSHRKKPMGILLISLYGILVGLLNVMEGVYSIRSYALDASRSGLFYLGLFSVFFGLVFLIAAIGIWAVQEWAYSLTRMVYMVAMGWTLIFLVKDRFSGGEIIFRGIEILVMLAILVYLRKADIRVRFFSPTY